MKCTICSETKNESEVLPGIPIVCNLCFIKINGLPKRMPPAYYQGFRDGRIKGKREERKALRRILWKESREALIERVLRR